MNKFATIAGWVIAIFAVMVILSVASLLIVVLAKITIGIINL